MSLTSSAAMCAAMLTQLRSTVAEPHTTEIPMRAHEIPDGILPSHREFFYGGGWHSPKAGVYADTINPAYNEPITQAPVADAADVDAAVRVADQAFASWSRVPPAKRGDYLRKAAA